MDQTLHEVLDKAEDLQIRFHQTRDNSTRDAVYVYTHDEPIHTIVIPSSTEQVHRFFFDSRRHARVRSIGVNRYAMPMKFKGGLKAELTFSLVK
jgi:hypothetical protein